MLTITANANAANHVPVAPWTSGGAVMFGAVLLGVPFTARRKRTLAVLLTAVAIMLAGFSMACSGPRNQAPADLYRHRDSHGNWHGDKPGASDH